MTQHNNETTTMVNPINLEEGILFDNLAIYAAGKLLNNASDSYWKKATAVAEREIEKSTQVGAAAGTDKLAIMTRAASACFESLKDIDDRARALSEGHKVSTPRVYRSDLRAAMEAGVVVTKVMTRGEVKKATKAALEAKRKAASEDGNDGKGVEANTTTTTPDNLEAPQLVAPAALQQAIDDLVDQYPLAYIMAAVKTASERLASEQKAQTNG